MRTMLVVVAVLSLAGCSKKKSENQEPAGSGTADTKGGNPPPTTPPGGSGTAAPPAAKPAPAVTHADVVAAEPTWTIEAMDRGLWFSENGEPLAQKCRVELGMVMGKMGKYRAAAEKAGEAATKCEAKGAYTACTFTNPDAAAAEKTATWIFGNDDDSDGVVLLAVVLGALGDWGALEPTLAQKKACPRPSQDPQ